MANAPDSEHVARSGRVLLGFFAIAIIPAVLLLDLWFAIAAGWQSSSNMPDAIIGLFGLVLAVAVVCLAMRGGRRFLSRRAPALLALLTSLCVAWLGAEWLTGRVFGGQLLFHRHMPHTEAAFHPTPEVMPGVSGEAAYTANSLGMRGPEIPEDRSYKILCVGGSTTACLFLDDTETWTRGLLDRSKPAFPQGLWVGDVGKSGYGSWHHVRLLDDDALLARIDCALFLVGINDFMRAVMHRPIFTPPGVKPLYERSNIFAVFHNWYQSAKQRRQYMEEFGDGATYLRRREIRRQREFVSELPDVGPGLEEYRTNLRNLIARCRAAHVRPVMMTQPVLWRPDMPPELDALLWLGEAPGGRHLSPEALCEGMALFNGALRKVCDELDVECIELTSMNGKAEYFFDDCHFSEAGAARVAEIAADHFR